MNIQKKIFLIAALLAQSAHADLFEALGLKNKDASLDVIFGDEKRSELSVLQKDIETLEGQEKKFWEEHNPRIEKVNASIDLTELALKKLGANTRFLNKKLLVLKTIRQVVSNLKSTWKEIISRKKRHIGLLEAYVKDPNFSVLEIEKRTINTFVDLEGLLEQIGAQEEKLTTTQSEKKEIEQDLANRKKKETAAETAYKDKVQEQVNFSQEKYQKPLPDNLDVRQYGEILDAQVTLQSYEKELATLRVKEEEIELATVTSQLEIEEKKFQILQKKRDLMTRMSLRVDEKDVALAKEQLVEKRKQYLNEVEVYNQEIEQLNQQKEEEKKLLAELNEQHKGSVEDASPLVIWATRPATGEGLIVLGKIGQKVEALALIDRKIDLLQAQSNLKKVDFERDELSTNIIESWYKIKHQRLKTNEEFDKERKRYEAMNNDLERERVAFEEKRKAATSRWNMQNKALTNIQELTKKLDESKDFKFKTEDGYAKCVEYFKEAETLIRAQIEVSGKLVEGYSKILVSLSRSRRQVTAMIDELQRVNLWHRSGRAISWRGLGNLIPDVRAFFSDVRTLGFSYLAGLTIASIWNRFIALIEDPFSILLLIIQILMGLGIFFFLHRYLPFLSKVLANVSQETRGAYLLSLFLSMFFEFLYLHLTGFFLWSALFAVFGMAPSPEMPSILFFLLSIFYLLYWSKKFTAYFAKYNEDHEYVFFSESFQERFIPFLNWFLASTVIIFCFREAFILATYTKSELPDILLALYSIIIRVLLLSLIRKEDLLNIIPTKTDLSAAIWRFIDHYYYPVLLSFIIVMILMDPHIGGYNNLVYYLVWGILGTVIVMKVCYELYVFCRKSASVLFFSSDGEILNERFKFSKTLYGLSVILLFVFFTVFCVICIAWVWGKPISFDTIKQFFLADRLTIKGAEGELQKLSIMDFLRTFMFVPLGFLIGYIVDHFVVHRIFSVLLVNPGVHNAVSTITYYIIVIAVITIGLWSEGFGFVVAFYIAPIILGIAWALRDIFNDFVAYFVILIQRPLKIGDYIMIDSETRGVVRTISPRAVVLRRKKGFCIIIPNARIIRETVINWDYNLNFIVCPDIKVSVPYRFNPKRIKETLWKAADMTENVLKTPPPVVRLDEFGENGFSFMIRVYISSEKTLLQWETASNVRFNVIEQLRINGMEVAFPVRVIRMRNLADFPEDKHDYHSHQDNNSEDLK